MRLPTHLRAIRVAASLSLTEAEDQTGIGKGTLSMYETGRMLPNDKHLEQLELVYGDPATWYEPRVLLLLQNDDAGESGTDA